MDNDNNKQLADKSSKNQNIANERVIEYLRSAIFDGKCGLSDVPNLIKRVIKEDLWQERILPQTQEKVKFQSFEEFLTVSPPEGLGTNLKTLGKLCADDIETLDLIEQVKVKRFHGGDRRSKSFKVDNINFEKVKKGTSVEYSLKRLKKQCPELHQQVLQGKISVNQAMILGGFRRKTFSISKNIPTIIVFIKNNFSKEEINQLINLLKK